MAGGLVSGTFTNSRYTQVLFTDETSSDDTIFAVSVEELLAPGTES